MESERHLSRIADRARWAELTALAPVGDITETYTPASERGMIFDLATLPGAEDADVDVDLIAQLAGPAQLYDTIAMLCRELLRLRVEVDDLRRRLPSIN